MFRKRVRLIEQICAPENLADAWRRVRRNIRVRDRARSRGPDGVSIADFERHLEANLAHLGQELRQGSYHPQPVGWFTLPKRGGGRRAISILAVRDRVAQRAVQNVIEPLFEAQFLDCSYGFRPRRSVSDAVARLVAYRQSGYAWVLDADIRDCFDSLEHRLLMRSVRRVVREPAVHRLIQAWLDAGVMGALADERAKEKRSAPWDGLLDAAARHLERALDWGLLHLIGEEEMLLDDADLCVANGDHSLDHESVRRRALGRLGREALVLALSFSRPLMDRARQSLPQVGKVLRRRNVAVAALASLGVALLPFAYRALAEEERADVAVGAPQGAVLSPLLANAYLHSFDQAMVRRGFKLVRYADDVCVVGHSRAEVERAQESAEQVLARLKLSLNEEKTRILRIDEGFAFLGTQFQARGIRTPPAGGVRQAAKQAGEHIKRTGWRALRSARQQGGQVMDNVRRTAKDVADDFKRIRFLGQDDGEVEIGTEEADGYGVSDRTGHDAEQDR